MATSNVNMVVPSFSIDIDSQVGGVSMYEVHENVDLNQIVVNAINKEINEERENLSALSNETCIYKVPKTLRCVNPEAYTPKTVSIGPIHYGNKEFKKMEEIKRIFLKSFLNRNIDNKCLKDYVDIIIKEEKRLRSAYLEPIEFKSHEFVKIIMLDAAFIIEFLLMVFYPVSTSSLDVFHFNYPRQMFLEVPSDLLQLENQIPFFILQDLLDLNTIKLEDKKLTIAHLFLNLFEMISPFQIKANNIPDQPKHCLDFMRILYKPSDPLDRKSMFKEIMDDWVHKEITGDWVHKEITGDWVHTPTITELYQAGVKFKAVHRENWFVIKFNNRSGVLKLPHLIIDSDFEERIRNLMAYEQCHHHIKECNICDYAILMDDLINTQEDVQLLVKYEIIINALEDNSKVCALFNNISQGIYRPLNKFYYVETKKYMIKYCKNPIHPWKASLEQNYFNTPWKTASVIAAILLLLLTITQAVTSVMSLI